MFRFCGSTHTRYCTYLLEMICILELESSPALRDVFLKNWLVNPSGEPGRNIEGDLFQEHINLDLEEGITWKNTDWDSPYIREVHAPNVVHFVELKNEWGRGVGLAKRRGNHPEPHSRPEIRTLLRTYKTARLHLFRAGRSYKSSHTPNMMEEGIKNLFGGKMKRFVLESTRARIDLTQGQPASNTALQADRTSNMINPTLQDISLEERIRQALAEVSDSDSSANSTRSEGAVEVDGAPGTGSLGGSDASDEQETDHHHITRGPAMEWGGGSIVWDNDYDDEMIDNYKSEEELAEIDGDEGSDWDM